jgi:hypothetical protein
VRICISDKFLGVAHAADAVDPGVNELLVLTREKWVLVS